MMGSVRKLRAAAYGSTGPLASFAAVADTVADVVFVTTLVLGAIGFVASRWLALQDHLVAARVVDGGLGYNLFEGLLFTVVIGLALTALELEPDTALSIGAALGFGVAFGYPWRLSVAYAARRVPANPERNTRLLELSAMVAETALIATVCLGLRALRSELVASSVGPAGDFLFIPALLLMPLFLFAAPFIRFRRKVRDDGPVWPDIVILASSYLAFMYTPVPVAG